MWKYINRIKAMPFFLFVKSFVVFLGTNETWQFFQNKIFPNEKLSIMEEKSFYMPGHKLYIF